MVNAYRKGIYRMVNELPGTESPFFGDINEDGMVNVMDLIALIGSIMGYDL